MAELPRDARLTAASSACEWRMALACRRALVTAPTGCRELTAAPLIPLSRPGARPVNARPGCGSPRAPGCPAGECAAGLWLAASLGTVAWAWLAVGESNRYRLYSRIRAIRFAPYSGS